MGREKVGEGGVPRQERRVISQDTPIRKKHQPGVLPWGPGDVETDCREKVQQPVTECGRRNDTISEGVNAGGGNMVNRRGGETKEARGIKPVLLRSGGPLGHERNVPRAEGGEGEIKERTSLAELQARRVEGRS